MDVDAPRLELVEDDFTTEQHKKLDNDIKANVDFSAANIDDVGPLVLQAIMQQLGDRANREYRTPERIKSLLEEPGLREMLLRAQEEGYRSVRCLKILRIPSNATIIDTPSLELDEDHLTEDDHKRLDAELLSFNNLTRENIKTAGPLLLQAIVGQLGNRAFWVYRYPQCRVTLLETPEIQDMLLRGPREGYRSVRCLKILRLRTDRFSGTRAARRSWTIEFVGDYHKIMLQNINNMDRSDVYANSTAVIQSSGYGKSRMVDEMAKLVFTIPLNVRDPADEEQGAWPPADADVWGYFHKRSSGMMENKEAYVSQFFSNLFAKVNEEVKKVFFGKQGLQLDAFARRWRDHLSKDGNRKQLYKRVIVACQAQERSPGNSPSLRETLATLLFTLDTLCAYPKSTGVKIMLYFDEAHELDEQKLYDAMRSVLGSFKSAAVFTVFLSTLPSIGALAPSVQVTPSGGQQNRAVPRAPITEAPFDCHPAFPIQLGKYTLEDVGDPNIMARFGRPLFWTIIESTEELPKGVDFEAMNLARMKLIFDHRIFRSSSPSNRIAALVLLDVLISIDYDPMLVQARDFQSEMIASHMRTAFSIPADQSYIHSGYTSEPFLAEAASCQVHEYTSEPFSSFALTKVLMENFKSVDLSHKDELVMRLLLRKAYMDAVAEEQKGGLNFSRGCSLLGFLKALFPEHLHASVLNCQPANKGAAPGTLSDVFSNAVVRFTHFSKAADEFVATPLDMAMAFMRALAIIGPKNQGSVVAIPILVHKDDKIEVASISALLVQVRAGSQNAYFAAQKIRFFPETGSDKRLPYVTLVVELGVERTSEPVTTTQSDTLGTAIIPRKSPPKHPRYSIQAYGCTHRTWKIVNPWDDWWFSKILSIDNLLADHARQDKESLHLARQLAPYLYVDAPWFSGPIRRPEELRKIDIGWNSEDNSDSEVDDSETKLDASVAVVGDENA